MYNIILLSYDVKLLQKKPHVWSPSQENKYNNYYFFFYFSQFRKPFTLFYVSTYSSNCDDSSGLKFI